MGAWSSRGGNRAGRAGLGRANSGPGQNRAGPKLARCFLAKILTAQPALKTEPVGPNSIFKAKKKIRSGRAGPYRAGPNLARFFRAKNLMAQPGPNFGRTGLGQFCHLYGVGPCIGLNEIKSLSPMTNFITINYLFNFIFGFIR